MADTDPDIPEITDRDDVIWFLEHNAIPLPEGLTVEKITRRGKWWTIEDDAFSFRMERHPSPLFTQTGRRTASPARWHIRKRYRYNITTGEWTVKELDREFNFEPWLLIDAVFDQGGRETRWANAIDRVQEAEDPEPVFEDEFASMAEFYRKVFADVPEDQMEEMIVLLEDEFRRRAGID